jgi:hypothetical protein
MPFDANLVLCDGSADWSYANLVTSDYGSPTSTTRNSGGFAVIDLLNEGPVSGLAVVLVLADSANAADDALTVIVEDCDDSDFSSSQPHELGKLDIAAATKGVILGSECPATVVYRCTPTRRYIRIDASCNLDDDFGTVYALLSPYPFKTL